MINYIQKMNDVKTSEVKVPKFNFQDYEYKSTFNFETAAPRDNYSVKQLWDEDTKAVLMNATRQMGISNYSPSKLSDDNVAIAKAQTHLIDMLKYFEGDRNYYYEAYTTPYQDKFKNWTHGFGELGKKKVTQKQAYEGMCKKLEQASKEVKNVLNKRIANGTYEALPNSIKEVLIDLCYNKGLPKITQNAALMQAIKSKDYSGVIKNSVYLYSGKSGAEKKEEPGLYTRSLNRMILGTKDLQGKELQESKQEIENVYKRAKACFAANNKSTMALDKIYEQYKTGKISAVPISAESYKVKVEEKFKGKGLFAIAQAMYKELGTTTMSFNEFYKQIKDLNNEPDSVEVGQELKIPAIKEAAKLVKTGKTEAANKKVEVNNAEQKESVEKEEKSSIWKRIGNGIVNFFKSIGNWFKNLFSKKEEVEEDDSCKTPFQRLLKKAQIKEMGELSVISYDYTVKQGDNLWKLAKEYDTNVDRLTNDNKITDASKIKIDQHINIQKLGYKVKKGDNLFQISKKFGLTVEMLKDLNNIEDVNQIKADEMIEIPGFIYETKEGDSLEKIAKQMEVSVNDLKKINNMSTDEIKAGQKLIVVYNDSDYSVAANKKKVTVDKATNTTTEVVDMSSNKKLKNRPLLQEKRRVNGQVEATRHVFEPTGKGKLSGKTIIVNAGHGYSQAGTDAGTTGIDNVEDEWLHNYDNAIRLTNRLCRQGAKVIFLQGGVNIIGKEIEKKENKADLFISVHVNACETPTQDRTQVYFSKNHLDITKKSEKLAQMMERNFDNWIPKHEKISAKEKFINPSTKKQDYAQSDSANYLVLRESEKKQNIPAVLWETAFMISPKGRERLTNPKLMDSYSDLMTKSVVEYFS